ncbi:MAG TPA: hypothetical protein VLG50_05015 [Candidatus Saccharimonadales bacterium]|nr:hypothetical protein [Candidatus Saccharimonadales bacterium]
MDCIIRYKYIYKTIEEQMLYADAITRRYALNPHFHQCNTNICANTTTVGNVAFMAYYNGMDSKWGLLYNTLMDELRRIYELFNITPTILVLY